MKWMAILVWTVLALALVWAIGSFVWWTVRRSKEPSALAVKWALTFVLGFLMVLVGRSLGRDIANDSQFGVILDILMGASLGVIIGIIWVHSWGSLLANTLTNEFDGGDVEVEPTPTFAIIEAKRKLGKYAEALAEAQTQLEAFPSNYQLHMLIAEIQTKDTANLSGGIETIESFLAQPDHLPSSIAYALGRMADWLLEYRHDRAGAKAALERIIELLPDTSEAQIARQRIAHLASEEMLAEKGHPHLVTMRHYEDNIGLRGEVASVKPPGKSPPEMAAEYVKHLEAHPADNEVRERLAMIYAEHYQRLDLATREFEQLVAAPNQLSKHVVRWLSQLSDLQIQLARDGTLARATLQRIVDTYPGSAAAEGAIARMRMIERGLKRTEQPREVKIGNYEGNVGLNP